MKLNIKKTPSLLTKDSLDIRILANIQSPEDLAKFVKNHRKKNKLSQEEVALFANVSRLAISEFENSKSDIRLSTLLKIIKACSLDLQVKER